jgi:hypothetical protein
MVGLVAVAILYAGTAFVPPISGRVVDAFTGEPIEGIAVTLEYTRFHGLGPTTTVAYAQAITGRSGRFWLKPLVGWSGLVFPAIGEHWLTVNHVHHEIDGSFSAAEVQVLYNPRSNQRGARVGNPAYFPVTLAYSERMPCGLMNAWSATCVDERSSRDITIPLVPAVDDVGECGRIVDSTLQDRCRQLNTYRAAFEHVDAFDEVQRSLNICGGIGTDRIRKTCRDQVAVYAANPDYYGRREPAPEAEPRLALLFPVAIEGENRSRENCDPSGFAIGHLDCRANYGEGPNGLVSVTIEEWVDRDEPPLEKRDLLKGKPNYLDSMRATVTPERRPEGTIRMYRGPEYRAADWTSRNRYIRVFFQEPTKKEQAFIDHFLKAFPSTLRAGAITSP